MEILQGTTPKLKAKLPADVLVTLFFVNEGR